ncbi:sugar transporter STL1 [Alternaria alternata]|nr:sugar transporter STL1 [Alternaria alternata]
MIDFQLTSKKKKVKTRGQQNNGNEALAPELEEAHNEDPEPNSLVDRKELQNSVITDPGYGPQTCRLYTRPSHLQMYTGISSSSLMSKHLE